MICKYIVIRENLLQIFVHLDCPGDERVSSDGVYAEMSKLDPKLKRADVKAALDALNSDTAAVDFDDFLYTIAQIGAVSRKEFLLRVLTL